MSGESCQLVDYYSYKLRVASLDVPIRARPLPKDFVGVHHIVERRGARRAGFV